MSQIHSLYYELVGNPAGIPCVYFHGGPGGGFEDGDKRFFDFKKYQVLFFDQRGAGRSRPFASTLENTTDLLIKDAFALMDVVGFKQALYFGGSWGSTLALVTAIHSPARCLGLILRGIFLGNKDANEYYLKGAWRTHLPDVWERFCAQVPRSFRDNPAPYYFRKMTGRDKGEIKKFCFEWARMELGMMKPFLPGPLLDKAVRSGPYVSLATLEAHYISQRCFLGPNYILRNAGVLSGLPTWILHGRFDFVCPPEHALQLHRVMRGSRLSFVEAGHSSRDPKLESALCAALSEFKGKLMKSSRKAKR